MWSLTDGGGYATEEAKSTARVCFVEGNDKASDVYSIELAAYGGGKAVRQFLLRLVNLLSAPISGWVDGPSIAELVVRRRSDDVEVLRIDAGDEEGSGLLFQELRNQLETLTPVEFQDRWDVEPSA